MSNGKFIAFDVFLKTSTPADLYLTNSSGATYIGDKSVGIENAVRIAFIIEGNTPTSSSLNAIQAMKSGSENTTYIWEPNYDTHTKAAVTNASMIYNINTQENTASIIIVMVIIMQRIYIIKLQKIMLQLFRMMA